MINNEYTLTNHLVANIDKYFPECDILIARDEPIYGYLSNLGVPDLIYRSKNNTIYNIEVKFLNFQNSGRNACTTRTKHRKKVIQQALKYQRLIAVKYGISLRDVIPCVFTNDPGLRGKKGVISKSFIN
ncbi:MAG: hypothetical protein OEZ01_08645 [Candidatus Heimdallarchaeota archaeon]|nr:hypothetical protein [Candidatus Heimdallarchaeota archaeon]MDH5646062.1 hypothetical protein [Candidatus Heimdallarchaeota archaeon]